MESFSEKSFALLRGVYTNNLFVKRSFQIRKNWLVSRMATLLSVLLMIKIIGFLSALVICVALSLLRQERNYEKFVINFISSILDTRKEPIGEWLKFPEKEDLRFVNRMLETMWRPHLKEYFEKKMRSNLEKSLERRNKISSKYFFSIENFDLGPYPPFFTEMKVEGKRCGKCLLKPSKCDKTKCPDLACVMNFKTLFCSDHIDVTLSVTYHKVKAFVTLSMIDFKCFAQIKLSEYINAFPSFSKFSLSLLGLPEIDFKISYKSGSLKLNYLPMISRTVEDVIKRQAWRKMLFPAELVYHLHSHKKALLRECGELVKNGVIFSEIEGKLLVNLQNVIWKSTHKNAHELLRPSAVKNWFCTVELKGGDNIFRSKIKIAQEPSSQRIEFDEKFALHDFDQKKAAEFGNVLTVEVWCVYNHFRQPYNRCLGTALVDLSDVYHQKSLEKEASLFDIDDVFKGNEVKSIGDVCLTVQYVRPTIGVFDDK